MTSKTVLHSYLISCIFIWMGYNGFRYTTDGGSRETLEKGTIRGDDVFSGTAQNQNALI